jgi:alkyl hydroperoxide reductase subunit AhpC
MDPDQEEDYDQEGVELISSSLDNRIQHIKVKGDITKALSAQHQFE